MYRIPGILWNPKNELHKLGPFKGEVDLSKRVRVATLYGMDDFWAAGKTDSRGQCSPTQKNGFKELGHKQWGDVVYYMGYHYYH